MKTQHDHHSKIVLAGLLCTFAAAAVLFFNGCGNKKNYVDIEPRDFQQEYEGAQVDLFTLRNDGGARVQITNYGARIVSIIVPDRDGNMGDVCLGYTSLEGYLNGSGSMGATIGRYAGRIGNAQFTLDSVQYHTSRNNGPNTIHGGEKGFRFVVWEVIDQSEQALTLRYRSSDGEEGFPGNLDVTVQFSLSDDNALRMDYRASTDRPTVVNLTNHAFFNLAGEGTADVYDHELMIRASQYTPLDEHSIPTGEYRDVEGTPFDFRRFRRIGDGINAAHPQIQMVDGYDHNFVLDKPVGTLAMVAVLFDPSSGRSMEVHTTEPGLQVYTANSLTGEGGDIGKGGKPYGRHSAICLETQHFPDSPNKPQFPSTRLDPGTPFNSQTLYKFGVGR